MKIEIDILRRGKLAEGKIDPNRIRRESHKMLTIVGARLEAEVKLRTPVGVTGNLRRSIGYAVDPSGTELNVFAGQESSQYAIGVEKGCRPHWAPIGPLVLWVKRKLGPDPKLVAQITAGMQRRTGKKRGHKRGAEERAIFAVAKMIQRSIAQRGTSMNAARTIDPSGGYLMFHRAWEENQDMIRAEVEKLGFEIVRVVS